MTDSINLYRKYDTSEEDAFLDFMAKEADSSRLNIGLDAIRNYINPAQANTAAGKSANKYFSRIRNNMVAGAGKGAYRGALGGAALGGALGFIDPDTGRNQNGQKNEAGISDRIRGAFSGALGGAALGGIGGAGVGAYQGIRPASATTVTTGNLQKQQAASQTNQKGAPKKGGNKQEVPQTKQQSAQQSAQQEVPQATPAAPQATPAAPQATPAAPQATPAAPQATPAAPQATPPINFDRLSPSDVDYLLSPEYLGHLDNFSQLSELVTTLRQKNIKFTKGQEFNLLNAYNKLADNY